MTITAQINVTPDGFCNHDDVVIDDDFMRFAIECIDNADRLLLGRTTFDLFEAHWPSAATDPTLPAEEQRLGRAIDGTPRTVASSTMTDSDWAGTTILATLDQAGAQSLRDAGKVLILGSPSIISQVADWGLLDRLLLSVHPLIGGKGVRLFAQAAPADMRCVRERETGAGVRTFEFARAA